MTEHIKYPHVTEKAVDDMDFENKMVFICHPGATKDGIVEEVEQQFDVTTEGSIRWYSQTVTRKRSYSSQTTTTHRRLRHGSGCSNHGTTHSRTTTWPRDPDVPGTFASVQGRAVPPQGGRRRSRLRDCRRYRTRSGTQCASRGRRVRRRRPPSRARSGRSHCWRPDPGRRLGRNRAWKHAPARGDSGGCSGL